MHREERQRVQNTEILAAANGRSSQNSDSRWSRYFYRRNERCSNDFRPTAYGEGSPASDTSSSRIRGTSPRKSHRHKRKHSSFTPMETPAELQARLIGYWGTAIPITFWVCSMANPVTAPVAVGYGLLSASVGIMAGRLGGKIAYDVAHSFS